MPLTSDRIMSTAGLRAQDIHSPLKNGLMHGTHFNSTTGSRTYWDQHHDLNSLCFGFNGVMEYNLKPQQQVPVPAVSEKHLYQSPRPQQLPPKKSRPSHLSLSSCKDPSLPSPPEGDQVVPSFQKLSVYEATPPPTPGRGTRPLPPLPSPADLSSDEAVDSEVEFFTSGDESQRLVGPEPCPKPALRYGAPGRRSFRGCGQTNYAYYEGSNGLPTSARENLYQHHHHHHHHHQQQQQQQQIHPQSQRRLRRSHSGPAGSLHKPAFLRSSCSTQDKPQIPPRVPIPPRPTKAADLRRWSTEVPGGDNPPKVPPRDPVCSSRTPSPKSLPSYQNGVMPPTQSFAPNPKYVSRGLQRQNSEGSSPPTHTHVPCILPIMENGRKASGTHYFLLPKRPAYLEGDRFDRFFREADCEHTTSHCDCETKHKANVHFV